jgi:hypothetical protein
VETAESLGDGRVAVVLATAGGFLRQAERWPVTLVAEALAQAILLLDPPVQMANLRLAALDNGRLLQDVGPGDRLVVAVETLAILGVLRRYRCRATRSGALVALADVTVTG